jgi:DNA-binding NtrC family response regulator
VRSKTTQRARERETTETTDKYSEARQKMVLEFDEKYAGALLRATRGNVSEAARRAGVERSNFRRLLRSILRRGGKLPFFRLSELSEFAAAKANDGDPNRAG